MFAAVQSGSLNLVQTLIDKGASGKQKSLQYCAFQAGTRTPMIELLLQNNVDLDLLSAASINEIDYVEKILSNDPEKVNLTDNIHRTPLHYAVYNNHVQMVQLLISKGADPSLRTTDHECALHFIRFGSFDKKSCKKILELLIGAGAAINDKTYSGRKISDDYFVRQDAELMEYLKMKGLKDN